MATKVTMPQLGESVVEGTIGKWLVSVGQSVAKDEPIVEILTDKADSELPAPVAGVVTQLLAAEDDIIAVGDPICEIDESAQASASAAPAERAQGGCLGRPVLCAADLTVGPQARAREGRRPLRASRARAKADASCMTT